jgi:hypothetical protein
MHILALRAGTGLSLHLQHGRTAQKIADIKLDSVVCA